MEDTDVALNVLKLTSFAEQKWNGWTKYMLTYECRHGVILNKVNRNLHSYLDAFSSDPAGQHTFVESGMPAKSSRSAGTLSVFKTIPEIGVRAGIGESVASLLLICITYSLTMLDRIGRRSGNGSTHGVRRTEFRTTEYQVFRSPTVAFVGILPSTVGILRIRPSCSLHMRCHRIDC